MDDLYNLCLNLITIPKEPLLPLLFIYLFIFNHFKPIFGLQETRVDPWCDITENGFYWLILHWIDINMSMKQKWFQHLRKAYFDHEHRQSSGNRRLSQTDQMGTRVFSATQKHPIEQVIVKSASMSYFRVSPPFFVVVFSLLIIIVIITIFCFWQHMQSSHHPDCPDSC